MRSVDIDQSCVWLERTFKCREIVSPIRIGRTSPLCHVGASRSRQLQRRFVAGCLDDNMIARLQERVICGEDSFFGCRDNDNVLRSGDFIDCGCSGAQFWSAFALRISKLLREESVCGVGFKCQNICNRNAFCITRRKQVGRSELVQCEVLLNTEWCDLHSTYDRNSKNGNASNEVLSNI